jgi:hypothetical protein
LRKEHGSGERNPEPQIVLDGAALMGRNFGCGGSCQALAYDSEGACWKEITSPLQVEEVDNDMRRMLGSIVDRVDVLADKTSQYALETRHMVYLTFCLVVASYVLHLVVS